MLDCNHNSGPAVLLLHSNVVMQAKATLLALLYCHKKMSAGKGCSVQPALLEGTVKFIRETLSDSGVYRCIHTCHALVDHCFLLCY